MPVKKTPQKISGRLGPRTGGQFGERFFREFIAELFAASAGMQSLRKAIARSVNIGSTELAILLAIWRLKRPKSIGIKTLAQHLHVAGPHITDEVAGLVRRGYLKKTIDPDDTRAVNLNLTQPGLSLLMSLAPDLSRINQILFEGMTMKDMLRMRQHYKNLIERSAVCIAEVRHRDRG